MPPASPMLRGAHACWRLPPVVYVNTLIVQGVPFDDESGHLVAVDRTLWRRYGTT
ncbi:hypothetical protein Vau01_075710 [Virgisporangium aurantiacum]|uniref:Uncharacterized protein n=1 Tax=Virgisporangium aurantiacum TaxID=175570 RepID=A0A8J4E2N8_9ACTN|nr:hypothetical protein Vau01_075710 [Virgisporangium aurantiacum]